MNSSSPRTESSTAAFSYRPSLNSTRLHGALIRYLLYFEPGVRKATDEEPWASKLLKPVAAEQHQRRWVASCRERETAIAPVVNTVPDREVSVAVVAHLKHGVEGREYGGGIADVGIRKCVRAQHVHYRGRQQRGPDAVT